MKRQAGSKAGTPLASVFETLSARRRPEDVAEMVREALGSALTRARLRTREKAARGSLGRRLVGYTSMLEEFAKPIGLERQVKTACEPFATAHPLTGDLASNPVAASRGRIGRADRASRPSLWGLASGRGERMRG